MKNCIRVITFLVIIAFSVSCEKESNNEILQPDVLSGNWRLYKGYGSDIPINNQFAGVMLSFGEIHDSSILIKFRNNHEYYFSYPDLETETGEYKILNDTLICFSPRPSQFLNFCFGDIHKSYIPDTTLLNQFPSYDYNFSLDTLIFKLPGNAEMEIYTFKMYEALVYTHNFTQKDTVAYLSKSVSCFKKL
jgi:hypothetical protein